ncbi:MAG: YdcF family protein [Negativicutes bacterium]|nr:YdcF family protein [Negativicutes bacterium]
MSGQYIVHQIFLAAITPPFCFLPLLIWAAYRMRRQTLTCTIVAGVAVAIYLLGTPYVSYRLVGEIERQTRTFDWQNYSGDWSHTALVVLAGGSYYNPPEYETENTVGDSTLRRLRYGAYLARRVPATVPVVVSGGNPHHDGGSVAEAMAAVLRDEFRLTNPLIIEDRSDDTWQNARYSWEILSGLQLTTVILVTDAWHMPRAVRSFVAQGFTVVPAPTAYTTSSRRGWMDWLPSGAALRDSQNCFYELGAGIRLWLRQFLPD